MAILPQGSLLIITGVTVSASPAVLVVDSLTTTPSFEPLNRLEFDNEKLRSAKNLCGQSRIIGTSLFGKPYQLVSDCSDLTAVPLGPNSDTNFNNIKRKFRIKEYNIQGAISTKADVDVLYAIAKNHQDQLAKFQHYLERINGDTPYETLIALQFETFSYLTTTGVSASGSALDTAESNILITKMSADTAIAFCTDSVGTAYEYYKTYNLTFQTRELVALNNVA